MFITNCSLSKALATSKHTAPIISASSKYSWLFRHAGPAAFSFRVWDGTRAARHALARDRSLSLIRHRIGPSSNSLPIYQPHVGLISGFGGLEVACWPLVLKFAGSNPAEAVGFLRVNKNPPHVGGAWMFVVIVVCCQVEVSATNWSLVQRSPTDCSASLCVI